MGRGNRLEHKHGPGTKNSGRSVTAARVHGVDLVRVRISAARQRRTAKLTAVFCFLRSV